MSDFQELKVAERDNTITPSHLRSAGFIPATVYGHGIESKSVQVRTHEFQQFYAKGEREFQLSGFVSGTAKIKNLTTNPVTHIPIALEFHLDTGTEGRQARKRNAAKAKAVAV